MLKRQQALEAGWRVMAHLRYAVRSVTRPTDREGTPTSATLASVRLDSWKEIASYLRRGIRTVQRWECEEGLPVHRLAHAKRGTVYADREELAVWWKRRQMTPAAKPVAEVRETPAAPHLERVTTICAATFSPALSSDARLIAYVSDGGQDGETPQVWLQQVGGGAMRLTSDQRECADPVFVPDDTRVIFTAKGETTRNLYEIPALGGQPRLLKRAAGNARFSPDTKRLAYVSLNPSGSLRIASADGGNDRPLAAGLFDVSCASWSPDSRYLLVLAHPDLGFEPDYWIVPIDGGSSIDTGLLRKLRPQGFMPLKYPPAWVGEHLIFSASSRQGGRKFVAPAAHNGDLPTDRQSGTPHARRRLGVVPGCGRWPAGLRHHAPGHESLVGCDRRGQRDALRSTAPPHPRSGCPWPFVADTRRSHVGVLHGRPWTG